jgi:hypothetical protein
LRPSVTSSEHSIINHGVVESDDSNTGGPMQSARRWTRTSADTGLVQVRPRTQETRRCSTRSLIYYIILQTTVSAPRSPSCSPARPAYIRSIRTQLCSRPSASAVAFSYFLQTAPWCDALMLITAALSEKEVSSLKLFGSSEQGETIVSIDR